MTSLRPRAWWILFTCFTSFLLAMWADDLLVQTRDDELHISTPRLHFLTGASIERLKNGASVPFDFQLSLSVDSRTNLFDRAAERFAVSYDLWEEKYSVARLSASSSLRGRSRRRSWERRSASHLTPDGVERWCIDNMFVSTNGVESNQFFWVRLEIRSVDPKEPPPLFGESGVSLNRLIDLFSHPPHSGQQRWSLETGPIRLGDLRKSTTRDNGS